MATLLKKLQLSPKVSRVLGSRMWSAKAIWPTLEVPNL